MRMTPRQETITNKGCIPVALMERMAVVLRVLAHPQRLKIVELLESSGPASVSQIQIAIKMPQAVTSQHLGQMKRVGLLNSSRRGKEVLYQIADPRALTILDCIRRKQTVML